MYVYTITHHNKIEALRNNAGNVHLNKIFPTVFYRYVIRQACYKEFGMLLALMVSQTQPKKMCIPNFLHNHNF